MAVTWPDLSLLVVHLADGPNGDREDPEIVP